MNLLRALALSAAVFCSTVSIAEPDIHELAKELKLNKDSLVQTESAKRRILGSLFVINRRMRRIAQNKSRLTDQLFHTEREAKAVAQVIAALQVRIDEQKRLLHARLRVAYKLSGESYLAVLFSQSSSHDLDQAVKFMQTIAKKDYQLLASYERNVAEYKSQKHKLNINVAHLLRIEDGIRSQEGQLMHEQVSKGQIISELDRERLSHLDKIKGLRSQTKEASNDDDAEIAALLNPSFFEQKGLLPAPAKATVVQEFGLIREETNQTQLGHKGWTFSMVQGSSITNIFAGVVAHIGPIPGYGQVMVIDHGDHYYTVFAHIARAIAKVGETVGKGQRIAEAGMVTPSESGFYFEIRHFSEPENPRAWIQSSESKISALTPLLSQGDNK